MGSPSFDLHSGSGRTWAWPSCSGALLGFHRRLGWICRSSPRLCHRVGSRSVCDSFGEGSSKGRGSVSGFTDAPSVIPVETSSSLKKSSSDGHGRSGSSDRLSTSLTRSSAPSRSKMRISPGLRPSLVSQIWERRSSWQ